MSASDRRWAWAEIDLSAIAHNVATLKALTPPLTRFMAVVKADGYGHGSVPVARAALVAGATDLGVATVDEAIVLRDAGFTEPLMVLSEPPVETAAVLLERSVVPTVTTRDFALAYAAASRAIGTEGPYHLKIDSGMNRIGVRAEDAAEFAYALKDFPGLALAGTFTHFATADAPGDWEVERQLQRFRAALDDDAHRRGRPGHRPRSEQPRDRAVPRVPLRHGSLRDRDLRSAALRDPGRRSRTATGHVGEGACHAREAHRHRRGRQLRSHLASGCAVHYRDAAARVCRRGPSGPQQPHAGASRRRAARSRSAGCAWTSSWSTSLEACVSSAETRRYS